MAFNGLLPLIKLLTLLWFHYFSYFQLYLETWIRYELVYRRYPGRTHFYCVDVWIGIRERICISGTRGIFSAYLG